MHDQTRDVDRPAELCAQALRSVVVEHGRRIGQSPRQVRALLSDELGADAHAARAYVDALVIAAEEGVPHELAADPRPEIAAAARATLRAEGALSEAMAAFAVSAWAAALGRGEAAGASAADATVAAAAPTASEPGRAPTGGASESGPMAPVTPWGAGSAATVTGSQATVAGSQAAVAASRDGATDAGAATSGASAPPPGVPPRSPGHAIGSVADGPAVAAQDGSEPGYVGDEPSRRAGTRARLVGAGVAAAAVLALVVLVWSGSRAILGGSGEGAGGSHSGHSAGAEATDAGGGKAQPPMHMPSATAVPSSVMAAVTATAGADSPQVAPTGPAVGTPPVAIKGDHPTLAAVPQERSVQLQLTSSDQPGCAEVTGQQDLRWCELTFEVSAKGTVKDWKITDVALVEQHGKASVHGHTIRYQPYHNGTFEEHISYRLAGGGVRSGVGVIRIHAACNTNYVCH